MEELPAPLELLPHLPNELIILEILPRLPVKSLLKFRCVSKSWLSSISTPHFIKAHLEKSSQNKDHSHHSLIAHSSAPHLAFKNCSVQSLLQQPVTHATNVNYPVANTSSSISVVGSCNGLICIVVNGEQIHIWNPSTTKSKTLNDSDFIREKHCYTIYGFGHDEMNDDYNVVAIINPLIVWGKYVEGKLHWPGFSGKQDRAVVSFDLAQAKYGELKLPINGDGASFPLLGVLGRCLCVMYEYQWSSVDLWVMKEYGVMESWIKMLTFPSFGIRGHVPLCISRNGEVLIQFESTLKLYNLQGDSVGNPKIMNMDECCDAIYYVESLVSANANDKKDRRHG
ncbi:F-box/kelch-repeat protein At3g23880-like [Coffea eugenioides]|uniref:F-box/kelch-repeat protein At3g23880-like n=1 Tax=Coffea eugenioides TaxID=49369 RepID=UPI000F605FC6|nr:F-box/kelch-repeat protein At3g23880-like [Coffea eugenioides]